MYKLFINRLRRRYRWIFKLLLVMKLILVIMTFCVLKVSAAGAQKLTFSKQSATLETVFEQITAQTGYKVLCNADLIHTAVARKVHFRNATVRNILTTYFPGKDFAVTLRNKTIIIHQLASPKGTPAAALSSPLLSQIQVTGTVTDSATGAPLAGVTVQVKGSAVGTATDASGKFSLSVPDDAVLVISYIGYAKVEVPVNGQTTVNVKLRANVSSLDQLVVVGYGTQKKSDLTGAIGSVAVDSLNEGVVSSVNQLIQGKVAGVSVVQNSGKPGSALSIIVRGASSINASNRPLYVIDGVPISSNDGFKGTRTGAQAGSRAIPRSPLASLNPMDIKSIQVLKGPSAKAIYGSRGANGVVLITTKEGHSGSVRVNYNAYIGIQNPSNQLDVLTAEQYKKALNAIIDAGGGDEDSKVGEIKNRTNWQDEITNANAVVQNHQLSFSGGSDHTTYYLSLNYMDQDGTIVNSGFKRYSARLNLNSKITDKFSLSLRLTSSFIKNNFASQGGGINENAGALYAAYNYDPTLGVRDVDGNYILSPLITIDNPVALAKGVNSHSKNNRTMGALSGRYDLTDHLYGEATIAADISNDQRKSFISEITKSGQRNSGLGSYQGSAANNFLVRGGLHYDNTFGIHQIKAFAGISYQDFITENTFMLSGNYPSTVLGADNLGLGDQTTFNLSTDKVGHRLASYIGRVNYMMKNKYLLTTTLRFDGSSRFGANNRFAAFPSVALGWKLNEERFLQSADAINELKLRVAWGESGNQGIGNYQAVSTFQEGQVAIWDNQPVTTTTPARLSNPDLKWEVTKEFNIGLDYGFLNYRITGSLNYYRKNTTDMLLNLPVPQSTGYNTRTTNIGSMVNKGFELSLTTRNVSNRNFNWTTDISLATLKNKVTSLGPLSSINIGGGNFYTGNPAIDSVGLPLNSFYGYKIIGIWQQDDDYSTIKDNVKPGDLKFKDVNGDHTINGADRVILGNSFPDFSGFMSNTFSYKDFKLLFAIRGAWGMSMLNLNMVDTYYPVNLRRNKFAEPVLNRWTPEHPSNKYPSFVNPFDQGSKPINSYVVEDASYLKLSTVRLSYTFSHFKNTIRNLTVYVTGGNLVTLTDYVGIDPAINPQGSAAYRIDYNTYPTSRTFLFGVDINF